MSETTRPAHLSPKPFIALEDARIALDALTNAVRTARVELGRMEDRAANLLLSDQDVRDLLADYSVNQLAIACFCAERADQTYPYQGEDQVTFSALSRRAWEIERKLRAVGDNFQRAREAMAARIAAEAAKGAAA